MYDVIVIGAGLSGMCAGALAARRGARTLVIASGQGGANTSTGCLNILSYDSSGQPLTHWQKTWTKVRRGQHPYTKITRKELDQALAEFIQICAQAGYPMHYRPGENFLLPTAAGAVRASAVAPETMTAGELRGNGDMLLAAFPGLRDFYPHLAAGNLSLARPEIRVRPVALALPDAPVRRDAYASDLARLFDDPGFRAKVSQLWLPELDSARRVGFPAVLGLKHASAVRRDLCERLNAEVFEIPILPPSVPGMRLFDILKEELTAQRGDLILGPRVTGQLHSGPGERRAVGVTARSAGGPRTFTAGAVILASGGFLHGGLEAMQDGSLVETIFGLPVMKHAARSKLAGSPPTHPRYLAPHPYARFGLKVDEQLQPVNARGEKLVLNLYAIGGILAGADRISEGSREGIGVGTAWKAVSLLTGATEDKDEPDSEDAI